MHAQGFAIGYTRLAGALDCCVETDTSADSIHVWPTGGF